MKKSIILIFSILLFLTSCSYVNKHIIILWTNRPEVAAYVEEFNATHDTVKVEIEYRQYPGKNMKISETLPDLIFDEFLNSSSTIELFTPLDSLFEEEEIGKSLFYQELLKDGINEDHQVLLPVSFSLPAILFKKGFTSEFIIPFFMNLEELKKASAAVREKEKKTFKREGFSPLWNTESLFQISKLFNTDYRQLNSILSWNEDNLNDAVAYIKDWAVSINGGLDQEKEFIEKFLYDPKPKLLDTGRIAFSYTDLNSFFKLPPEKRKNLDFRWLSSESKVHALNSVLFAGIPRGAGNKKDAKIFLSWFFKTETQKKLLEATLHKRIRIFGIGQGFSSLREVNTNELPKLYPALMGHIPPESALIFPHPMPENWMILKEQIIKPWLYERVSQKDPPQESLRSAMEKWEKQNPSQNSLLH